MSEFVTTPTAPPVPGETEDLMAAGLAYWEARLVVKARQLRRSENRASMLLVRFDGPAMCLWRGQPFVTGQRVEMVLTWGTGQALSMFSMLPDGRVSE